MVNSIHTWSSAAWTVTYLPRPGWPQVLNHPETWDTDEPRSPIFASADDVEDEQSYPSWGSSSRKLPSCSPPQTQGPSNREQYASRSSACFCSSLLERRRSSCFSSVTATLSKAVSPG